MKKINYDRIFKSWVRRPHEANIEVAYNICSKSGVLEHDLVKKMQIFKLLYETLTGLADCTVRSLYATRVARPQINKNRAQDT